ncbi:ABC transporter permease [Lacrimispora sp. BS-2]|uniref:ABC transporter permease n=1 Tax=Lacrimispora sp. BS-2 TaxID=3151850 RepID=A0AAU7PLL7_9FIRM
MKPKQIKDHTGILSSIFAIILGLIVGLIILFLCNPKQALPGFATILSGAFTHGAKGVGQVFYYATPIILTGLSVGFAFKTGLFNIGTPGQFIMGGFGAVYVGILWTSLGPAHWVVALLASIILGAVWGLVPGLLKAYFNVNEVIASIMMNYIGMYLVNWIVKSYKPLFNNLRNESRNVAATANIPKMGLDKIFPGSSVNGGILIAILTVILIWLLLNKTTFGYELKAVGFNRDASKYAGINEKKSIILSMMIAGAIAGLAGGLLYLAGTGKHIEIKDVLASEGFTGISVALLGLSNPIGVLFSGIFIAYLTAGGFYLQLFEFSTEIIDIIVAVIIYFSAFALMVKIILSKIHRQKDEKAESAKEGGMKS